MSWDSVADDELAAFIDRILRMKSEEDAIKADIKEIYAEAKGRGYDKTRLGETVATVRKLEKDADGETEKEAIRDLYLTAYFRAKNKVGMVRATHTHAPDAVSVVRSESSVLHPPVESGSAEISTPIQPETANEMDRDVQQGDAEAAVPAENARKAIPVTEGGSVIHAGAGESPATLSRADRIKQLRPHCQFPERCGSSGGKAHCFRCRKDAGVAA